MENLRGINEKDWLNLASIEDFTKHDEHMKAFHRLHPTMDSLISMLYQLGTLTFSRPLNLTGKDRETGGIQLPGIDRTLPALIPIKRVTLPGGSQN